MLCNRSGAPNYSQKKEGDPLKTLAMQGDVGGFDEGRDAVAYKPHVLHRACGNNGGHLANAGLHDDLTQHLGPLPRSESRTPAG